MKIKIYKRKIKDKRIVIIGGGTGTSTLLYGLKKYPVKLRAIVTVTDRGGSSGILRDEFGILPPGDIRQCIVALAQEDLILRKLFLYRFDKGSLKGHNFGNIFMTALERVTGDFDKAVYYACKILNVKGKVIPVSLEKTNVCALLKNGKILTGQNNILKYKKLYKDINKIFVNPKVEANPAAVSSILKADMIVIGPGDFFTSLLPNLVIDGIKESLIISKAVKIFNCNLMTREWQTEGYSVLDFKNILEEHLGKKDFFDFIIYNNKIPSKEFLEAYAIKGEKPVAFDNVPEGDSRFIGYDLISKRVQKQLKGDLIERTLIRHNPDRIAKILLTILSTYKN